MKKIFFIWNILLILLLIFFHMLYKRAAISGELALFLTAIDGILFWGSHKVYEKFQKQ